MISKIPIKYIAFIVVIVFASNIFLASNSEMVFAKKNNDDNKKDKDQLEVKTIVHLENIDMEKTKFLRITAFINGDGFKQDIPISSIDKNKKTLNVDLKTDIDNGIVDAHVPDEFFVCGYQVGDMMTEYNSFAKFDCNEADILNIKKPTEINLFKVDSQVYAKSKAVYQANLNNVNGSNSDTVKIKIYAPLADKKDTKKLVIAAMIKGQIQSEVIEDVQAELDKSDGSTISRTFTFDRKTDIGLIQIGDRYHACVSSEDLRPPEGTECEKRIIKTFDTLNSLPAR
ncbi:MAG TPA: hypothetical protein VK882_10270 [Nitrososphaeraceae archaeon]|jgi:hypothetical protein|nr:hypothetical protein [Nitrososphaeraceae archaeon]